MHSDVPLGVNYYFVLPEQLINNNSGCFYQKGMGIQDSVHFSMTSGLSETIDSSFKILPNPTKKFVQLSNLAQNALIQIYNEKGRIVFSNKAQRPNSSILNINTEGWIPGIYFVKVGDNVQKLIRL